MTDIEALKQEGWTEKYGCWWPPGTNEWAIEQHMYLGVNGEHGAKGFLGKKEHFKRGMSLLFCHDRAVQPFEWNPNAEEILDAYFEDESRWTCVVGHGSSSKSRTVAGIGVNQYLFDPENTSCLFTSTTMPDGKRRIWADVERFWYNAGLYFGGEDKLPGILTHSTAMIRYIDRVTGREDEARGLALIPSGNDEDAKGSQGRMVGFKAPCLRLFLDEASHISWKVVDCAESNLETGGQVDKATGQIDFKVMATMNPNVKTDTGGKLCCPVDENGHPDWKAVDTTTQKRWRNKRGTTIRLSAYDSPNVKLALAGQCAPHDQPWTGLLTLQTLEDQRERLSEEAFQRQYLAIWPETEAIETIFTDQEVRHHGGHLKLQQRAELVAKIKGLDPAWSHGGDGAPLVFMDLVRDGAGRLVLEFNHAEPMDKGLDPTKDFVIQLENKVAARLNELKVQGKDFGMDITGGGRNVYSHILEKWPGSGSVGAVFNGEATDKPVSALDPTKANDKYTDLMTEMWMFLKELLMSGQLKNLPDYVIEEMCARRYGEKSGSDKKGRIMLEETRKMKKRLGRSPDTCCAVAICAHVAKLHYGLMATAKPARSNPTVSSSVHPMLELEKLVADLKPNNRPLARFKNLLSHPQGY